MSEKFTPEEVVARYRELGIAPRISMANVVLGSDGEWRRGNPNLGCCAMGVMAIGRQCPVPSENDSARALEATLGVDFCSFYEGFDSGPERRPKPYVSDLPLDEGDFALGRACREACIAAFGPEWADLAK